MNSKEIGQCIYCGSKDKLTKEHIVPKAFSGNRTLLKASCVSCARITSRFETDLLKHSVSGPSGMLYDLRVVLNMPSRRKSTTNVKIKQIQENEMTGERTEEMVDPDDYVGVVFFPIFNEPDCITGLSHDRGIVIEDIEWMTYVSNANKAKKGYKYGVNFRSRQGDFPRLLAKIAYGTAVFELGYERVKNSPLIDIILNNSSSQAKWIGCDPNNTMKSVKSPWAIELGSYKNRLAVKIKFLPDFPDDTPEYVVVIEDGITSLNNEILLTTNRGK